MYRLHLATLKFGVSERIFCLLCKPTLDLALSDTGVRSIKFKSNMSQTMDNDLVLSFDSCL